MRRICPTCAMSYDDEFRDTGCPHHTFAANDGRNHFAHHPESRLYQSYPHRGAIDALDADDREAAIAIMVTADDRERVRLIIAYWRDGDRADRSSRDLLMLHCGILSGMCDRLLDERPNQIGWGDKREKSGG